MATTLSSTFWPTLFKLISKLEDQFAPCIHNPVQTFHLFHHLLLHLYMCNLKQDFSYLPLLCAPSLNWSWWSSFGIFMVYRCWALFIVALGFLYLSVLTILCHTISINSKKQRSLFYLSISTNTKIWKVIKKDLPSHHWTIPNPSTFGPFCSTFYTETTHGHCPLQPSLPSSLYPERKGISYTIFHHSRHFALIRFVHRKTHPTICTHTRQEIDTNRPDKTFSITRIYQDVFSTLFYTCEHRVFCPSICSSSSDNESLKGCFFPPSANSLSRRRKEDEK